MKQTTSTAETKIADVEVLAPSAIEALERAQVDVQISTAHRFPRSLEQFKKRALTMATLDLETAESCIYSRPVGMKDGKQEYAEGASVRMAEIVAACYGNIRVASRIIEQTDRYVKCEGVAHDLESNYAGKSESFEPTVKKDGSPFSEGMRAVVAKAALAKAYRDAIFKVVPRALCKSIYEAALDVINKKGQTIEQRIVRVQQWLKSIKVSDERVFAALGIKGWAEVDQEKLVLLTGIKTAISENDTTIDAAFPSAKAPVATGPEAKKEASSAASSIDAAAIEKPLEYLTDLMQKAEVTQAQVVAYCKDPVRKMCGDKVEEVAQFRESSMRLLIQTWPEVMPKIKAVKVE